MIKQEKFVTNVEATYNTALARTTYVAALGKRGYTAEAIQAELAKLKAVDQGQRRLRHRAGGPERSPGLIEVAGIVGG